jgi:hypothetical protein
MTQRGHQPQVRLLRGRTLYLHIGPQICLPELLLRAKLSTIYIHLFAELRVVHAQRRCPFSACPGVVDHE